MHISNSNPTHWERAAKQCSRVQSAVAMLLALKSREKFTVIFAVQMGNEYVYEYVRVIV